MILFALKLLLAHVLGDFVLQPDRLVEKKRAHRPHSIYLYLHIGVHAFFLLLLLQFDLRFWLGILMILFSHFLIDLLKLYLEPRMSNAWLFLLDQMAHLLVLALVVYSYHPFSIEFQFLLEPASLLLILSLVFITFVSGILMKVVMNQWQLPEDKAEDSLPKAGKYIGMLERTMVFVFIILHQWSAIGWLIAAKSILRFSDLSRAKDRKLTEYVLIGTLLSVGLAIGMGWAYLYLKQNVI